MDELAPMRHKRSAAPGTGQARLAALNVVAVRIPNLSRPAQVVESVANNEMLRAGNPVCGEPWRIPEWGGLPVTGNAMPKKSNAKSDETYDLRLMRSFPLPIGIYDFLPEVNRAECLLIIAVARCTLGWQANATGMRKASAVMTHRRLKAATGCRSSTTISTAIDGLVRRGLLETLTVEGKPLPTSEQRRLYHRPLRFRIPRRLVETK